MPIQSFTPDNFRKIIDYENRRGLYLEAAFFPEAAKIAQEIKESWGEVLSVLDLPKPPVVEPGCQWCQYREASRNTGL